MTVFVIRCRVIETEDLIDPPLVRLQRSPIEGTPNLTSGPSGLDQPSLSQETQMPRNQWLTQVQLSAKLGHGNLVVLRQILDNAEPLAVRQSAEVGGQIAHVNTQKYINKI